MSEHDSSTNVLVVDDEDDLATLLEINLELAGYRVSVAGDGKQALDQIRRDPPDIVLLDVMMPELDGWQVLRQVKSDTDTRDIPVIMLTALSEERDLIRGHLQGAVRHVVKPFEMKALLRSVEDALAPVSAAERAARRRRTGQLLRRLAELDSGRTQDGPHVDLSRLERRPSPGERTPGDDVIADPAVLDELTDHQRDVAEQLADGARARDIAVRAGVSRSNVYAMRKRIARRLGVLPSEVGETMQRMRERTS